MKTPHYFIIAIISLFAFSCQPVKMQELKISCLFSDHMVLQQQQEVNFWGEYTPKQKVTLISDWDAEASTKVDEHGNWQIKIATPKAGGPYSINIKSKDSTIIIKDVLIGEVWLASGQSNMEMPLKGWPPADTILNSATEMLEANYPGIRMFSVANNFAQDPIDTIAGQWKSASSETVGDFSATAYFYAKKLHKELNIPIGIIHSSWGGTAAEAWTSKEYLRKLGDFDKMIDALEKPEMQDSIENWFKQWPAQDVPATDELWQNINFSDLIATEFGSDDSNWATIELPGIYDQQSSGEINGAFWLRKEFEVQDISSDYVLMIGAIDDMDATYINGHKIGGLSGDGFWNVKREYTISKSLLVQGTNTIAIRAIGFFVKFGEINSFA